RFAQGHDDDGEPTSAWDFQTMEGFGALRSTGNDLLRFLSANLGLTRTKLQAALEDCHKARLDTPDNQVRVGLGWHVLNLPGAGEPVICHSGETGGARAFLGFRKASGVGGGRAEQFCSVSQQDRWPRADRPGQAEREKIAADQRTFQLTGPNEGM